MTNASDRLKVAFKCIKKVIDQLDASKSSKLPISVESLQKAIEAVHNVKIVKKEVHRPSLDVGGFYERLSEKDVQVFVTKGQSHELIRYVLTKEMSHVVVDQKEERSPNGVNTVKSMFAVLDPELAEYAGTNGNQLNSEKLAEVAALEFLYPYKFRHDDRMKLAQGKVSYSSLSRHYDIPEFVVARALSRNYHEMCKQIWLSVP